MLDNKDIPVYLFTGMLESGKTAFIRDTLKAGEFEDGSKTLYILCEQGEIEIEEKLLKKNKVSVHIVEEKEAISEEFFKELEKQYEPDRVMIENNGMWLPNEMIEALPENWMMIQCINLIDGASFENYIANLGGVILEQIKPADLVVFNRVTDKEERGSYRRRVKALNRKAQVLFEDEEGNLDDAFSETLPFDLSADVIEIEDEDFGIWYLDAMDHPEKYHGKKVKFKGLVYKEDNTQDDKLVPGRFAMTCCAADISFIGFLCHAPNAASFKKKDWVEVVASVRNEYCKEYQGKGVVLYADEPLVSAPEGEQLVYFT